MVDQADMDGLMELLMERAGNKQDQLFAKIHKFWPITPKNLLEIVLVLVILYDKNLIHHAVLLKQLSRLFPKTDPPADEKLFRLPIAYLKDIVVQSLLDYIALSHSHPRFLYSLVLQFINV